MEPARADRTLIFDFIRTLYDPMSSSLYSGVGVMLEELAGRARLFLYSRADRGRVGLLREQGIESYFEAAYFVEEKSAENLRSITDKHSIDVASAVMIGDMPNAELCAASELGMLTVWVRGQAAIALEPACIPTHTVDSIAELHELLTSIV